MKYALLTLRIFLCRAAFAVFFLSAFSLMASDEQDTLQDLKTRQSQIEAEITTLIADAKDAAAEKLAAALNAFNLGPPTSKDKVLNDFSQTNQGNLKTIMEKDPAYLNKLHNLRTSGFSIDAQIDGLKHKQQPAPIPDLKLTEQEEKTKELARVRTEIKELQEERRDAAAQELADQQNLFPTGPRTSKQDILTSDFQKKNLPFQMNKNPEFTKKLSDLRNTEFQLDSKIRRLAEGVGEQQSGPDIRSKPDPDIDEKFDLGTDTNSSKNASSPTQILMYTAGSLALAAVAIAGIYKFIKWHKHKKQTEVDCNAI